MRRRSQPVARMGPRNSQRQIYLSVAVAATRMLTRLPLRAAAVAADHDRPDDAALLLAAADALKDSPGQNVRLAPFRPRSCEYVDWFSVASVKEYCHFHHRALFPCLPLPQVEQVAKLVRALNRSDFWFGTARRKRDAVRKLGNLAIKYDRAMAALIAAGGLAALVRLLRHRSSGVRESAARELGYLAAGSKPNKADIVAAGAVPALLQLLRRNSGDRAADEALQTLCKLADGGYPIQSAIMAAGTVPALVQLLDPSDPGGQMWPVATLCKLAKGGEPNRAAILAAGAVPLLVQLLNPTLLVDVQWDAADTLLSLAGGSSGAPAPKLLDPVAAASAVPALVRLLGRRDAPFSFSPVPIAPPRTDEPLSPFDLCHSPEDALKMMRNAAAAVLRNLAQSSETGMGGSTAGQAAGSRPPTVTAGTATALVQLLSWKSSAVQHVAAVVLGDLACFSEANRAAAVAAGAVFVLEQLVSDSSSSVRRAATRALTSLKAHSQSSHGAEQAASERFHRPR